MSLKLRYKEINEKKWKGSLHKLMHWFAERGYFEVYNKEYIPAMRTIRNQFAHPERHSFSGPHNIHLVLNALDIINGLYEDPLLRKKRMASTLRLMIWLESVKGIKVKIKQDELLLANAWPAFLNNKNDRLELHFYYIPQFEISSAKASTTNWIIPTVIYFKATEIRYQEKDILMINERGDELILMEIDSKKQQQQWQHWMDAYSEVCQPLSDYIYIDEHFQDTYTLHLRDFYKI